MAKYKEWEITTLVKGKTGTGFGMFRFRGDSKLLAHEHATWLRDNKSFTDEHGKVLVSDNVNERVRNLAVRFVGWVEE